MKHYYQDDWVTIYMGDNREIVPQLGRFDLLLTDPPYGISKDGQEQSTGAHGGRKAYDFLGWDAERPRRATFDLLRASCDEQVIWGGNYFADLLPPTMRWLVWDKGQRINQSDGELAWTSAQAALRIFTLNRVALMQDGAEHPTQKPLALISWCLSFFPDAQTVLDPFAGSGTTGRACKDLGRKCVMIEREEAYCEIAARRMGQEVFDFSPQPV